MTYLWLVVGGQPPKHTTPLGIKELGDSDFKQMCLYIVLQDSPVTKEMVLKPPRDSVTTVTEGLKMSRLFRFDHNLTSRATQRLREKKKKKTQQHRHPLSKWTIQISQQMFRFSFIHFIWALSFSSIEKIAIHHSCSPDRLPHASSDIQEHHRMFPHILCEDLQKQECWWYITVLKQRSNLQLQRCDTVLCRLQESFCFSSFLLSHSQNSVLPICGTRHHTDSMSNMFHFSVCWWWKIQQGSLARGLVGLTWEAYSLWPTLGHQSGWGTTFHAFLHSEFAQRGKPPMNKGEKTSFEQGVKHTHTNTHTIAVPRCLCLLLSCQITGVHPHTAQLHGFLRLWIRFDVPQPCLALDRWPTSSSKADSCQTQQRGQIQIQDAVFT